MSSVVSGFGTRLKTQLGKLFTSGNSGPQSYTARARYTTNIDVNTVKMALSEAMGPDGGFSQPAWGPEISTVGAYSREGYTSRTFDTPTVPFVEQTYYVRRDEDVQLALNHLTSQITGGEHYWKSEYEEIQDYLTQFSTDIDFDWIDTIVVKELLAYGNTVWKPRLGIANIRNRDDLMHIPISSFVRIWWDRQRRPYKFEFRGSEYQGYHNAEDVIHLFWNPINASLFGTGFLTALVATRDYTEATPAGPVSKKLPSLMDRKYSTSMTMHLSERRYVPHNVYQAINASADERAQLSADVGDLETGEDIIVGNKVEVTELGSNTKAFNPTQFTDLTQGAIFKALNDFRGKQGSESSHQYANAETSAVLDEIGLASFPLVVTRQLCEKLFQPWYEANGEAYDQTYGGGMLNVPWKEANPELNFGRVQKQDLETKDQLELIKLGIESGAVCDPAEQRKLLEDAGLGLTKEGSASIQQQYNPVGPIYPPNFDTHAADVAPRSMDSSDYTVSQRDFMPPVPTISAPNPQPSAASINFTANRQTVGNLPDALGIEDMNAFLATYETESDKGNKTIDVDAELKREELKEKQQKNAIRESVIKQIKELEDEEEMEAATATAE